MSGISAFNGRRSVPLPVNEPPRSYAPGSAERASIKKRLDEMASERIEIPLVIGDRDIRNGTTAPTVMPHDHQHVLADAHQATPELVREAAAAALCAREQWSRWPFEDRAAVFLKAADLLTTTWRDTVNAAT